MIANATGPASGVLMAVDEAIRDALGGWGAGQVVPLDSNPVGAMRALLQSKGRAWQGIRRVVVAAACEPLEPFPAGTVFEAVDYINFCGDNPAIGIRPSSHHSFFLDMQRPFSTGWCDRPNHLVDLAGWPADMPLDDAARKELRALGASIVSMHGVPQAIAARSLGLACTALFYAAGDRTGVRSVAGALQGATLSPDRNVQSLSRGVSNPYHTLALSYPRVHHTH